MTVRGMCSVYKTSSDEYQTHIRELSGPRPLGRVVDFVSKPRIWSCGAKAILLKSGSTFRIMGDRKDQKPAQFKLTVPWSHPDALPFSPVGVCDAEVLRY